MLNFGDMLIEESLKKDSALVVGLDPQINSLPNVFYGNESDELNVEKITKGIYEFNKIVIDAVYPYVVAVKPQLAYYEVYGSLGIKVLEETIKYAKSKGLLIINDAKRGDIGPTASAYAQAFLGNSPISGDAVTVNPYLGEDGIIPFIKQGANYSKGLFVLLKTSNPSAYQLQDLELKIGGSVYHKLASRLKELSVGSIGKYGFSNIGAVVGATYPEVAKDIRNLLPNTPFLVPGYGAQGGDVNDLKYFFNKDGNGSVISSSRAIIYSYKQAFPENWQHISRNEVKEVIEAAAMFAREEINSIR